VQCLKLAVLHPAPKISPTYLGINSLLTGVKNALATDLCGFGCGNRDHDHNNTGCDRLFHVQRTAINSTGWIVLVPATVFAPGNRARLGKSTRLWPCAGLSNTRSGTCRRNCDDARRNRYKQRRLEQVMSACGQKPNMLNGFSCWS